MKIRLKSIDEVGGKFWVRFTVNDEWFTQSFTRNSRGEFCVTAGSTVGQKTSGNFLFNYDYGFIVEIYN